MATFAWGSPPGTGKKEWKSEKIKVSHAPPPPHRVETLKFVGPNNNKSPTTPKCGSFVEVP